MTSSAAYLESRHEGVADLKSVNPGLAFLLPRPFDSGEFVHQRSDENEQRGTRFNPVLP